MRELAITSLILGIIGFLSSSWSVLGVLPSILAVVLGIYPLIKAGNQVTAIAGIALGLLGTIVSVAIINQRKRQHKKKPHQQQRT
jgi:membrane-bound ClpP family serine protease